MTSAIPSVPVSADGRRPNWKRRRNFGETYFCSRAMLSVLFITLLSMPCILFPEALEYILRLWALVVFSRFASNIYSQLQVCTLLDRLGDAFPHVQNRGNGGVTGISSVRWRMRNGLCLPVDKGLRSSPFYRLFETPFVRWFLHGAPASCSVEFKMFRHCLWCKIFVILVFLRLSFMPISARIPACEIQIRVLVSFLVRTGKYWNAKMRCRGAGVRVVTDLYDTCCWHSMFHKANQQIFIWPGTRVLLF